MRLTSGTVTEKSVSDIHVLLMKITGRNGVEIRDRKWRLKTYKTCFIGRELVDWLLKNEDWIISRAKAETFAQQLLSEDYIRHVW